MSFDLAKEEFKDFLLIECAFSMNTVSAYIRNLEKFENFLNINNGLKQAIADVQYEHLTMFIQFLNEETNLGTSSQAQVVATVKTFFKFLVMEEVITDSPAEFLASPKKIQLLPEYLTLTEVHHLLNVASHHKPFPHRAVAIISTLYSTGVRVSELINIKYEDLHFDVDIIKVLGKGNKERVVPIADFAQSHINTYLQTEKLVFENDKNYRSHIFITEKGKPLQREYIWTLIKTLAQKSQITKSISPHTFRHTLATHLKQAGADLNIIKEILGHESIADTTRYARLDNVKLREVIEQNHPANNNYGKLY